LLAATPIPVVIFAVGFLAGDLLAGRAGCQPETMVR
jgi:hypothetical protein